MRHFVPSLLATSILALGIALPGAASAQTLRQAMASSFTTSPTIRTAQAQVFQSIETYNQAVGNTKVQINGSLSGQASNAESFGPTGVQPASSSNSLVGQIDVTQNLFQVNLDGIPAGVRQVLGGVSSAHASYKISEMGHFSDVVSAYMGVLKAQGSLGVALSGVSTSQQEREAAQARLDAGEGTRTDIALADAGLAQAEANVALSRATLDSAKATFRQVIGVAPHSLSDPGFPTLPRSLSAAISTGLENSAAIDAAEIGLQVAQDAVITTTAQYGTNIAASASASYTWNDRVEDGAESYSFGLRASIPLFNSGIKEAAISSAHQDVVIAQASLDSQRAATRAQIEGAWASYQAQLGSLNSFIALASAQEVVLEATKAEFDAGTATFLQVLNAQQDFEEAQNQYISAKSDAVTASYTLLFAMGQMTTEALGLPVDHFSGLEVFEQNRDRTYQELIFGTQ